MDKRDERKWTADEVSRSKNILPKATEEETELKLVFLHKVRKLPVYFSYGRRHSGGMNFIRAYLRNSGTCTAMLREMHNKNNLEAEYRSVV